MVPSVDVVCVPHYQYELMMLRFAGSNVTEVIDDTARLVGRHVVMETLIHVLLCNCLALDNLRMDV